MFTLDPIQRRRLENFKSNKRAFWSLWIFLALFVISLLADLIANDKPLLIRYDGEFYTPIFEFYPETTFGGDFETEADYTDPFIHELIREEGDGWMIWPLIPYSYDTIVYEAQPSPSPPSTRNWLGTDDQARDVTARLIHGFRTSVTFGLILTFLSSIIGVFAGAIQGISAAGPT